MLSSTSSVRLSFAICCCCCCCWPGGVIVGEGVAPRTEDGLLLMLLALLMLKSDSEPSASVFVPSMPRADVSSGDAEATSSSKTVG